MIDRRLGIVALDEAVLGLLEAALGVGEVALRLVVRGRLAGGLGLRFERRLGGPDLLQSVRQS
jgi:hypothetical protein